MSARGHATMGDTVEGLPVLERLLLHLHHVDPAGRGSSPEHQTQAGISTAIGIQRKHVPRALRRLVGKGWIALELKRVDGHRQRLRVYVLSATGQEEIQRLRGALQNTTMNTMNGPEKVLDLVDAGRIGDLHTSVAREHLQEGKEANAFPLELAARLLGCSPDDLHLITEQSQDITSPATAKLDGSEAVFLSCLEMALTDGVITDDEEALLTTLRTELGPFGASLNAHVATVLHDMMK